MRHSALPWIKRCLFALSMSMATFAGAGDLRSPQPNIVLIFADDAGYGDFGFHGSKALQTPHLDELARQSIRFSQAYVTDPTCGPSRAGLLTGRYQQRFGILENNVPGYMSKSSRLLGDDMGLPLSEVTIADHLRDMGYRTGLLGKWHLGNADRYHPTRRGFDEFYGFRGGARSYFPYSGDAAPAPENRMERGFGHYAEHKGYLTDVLAQEAAEFIHRHRQKPFFLMVSFNAVHTPMEVLPEDLAQFPALAGNRRRAAALTLSLDRATGRILKALEETGLSDNTIIVFTNDNGGETAFNAANNHPLAGHKATHLEGGIRVPMLMRWPNRYAGGTTFDHPVSTLDLMPTFLDAAGRKTAPEPVWDGVSLLPFLDGIEPGRPHRQLYWKKNTRAAVRFGDWKLLRHADRPPELFDLGHDPSEQNDLAAKNPETVRQLFQLLFEWEMTLERPLWMLRSEYDKLDLDWMDDYRVPRESIEEVVDN